MFGRKGFGYIRTELSEFWQNPKSLAWIEERVPLRRPGTSQEVARFVASLLGERSNQYTFKVARDATKTEIRLAVEGVFDVKVRDVNTLNVKGKVKRRVKGVVQRRSWKKAYVRLEDGQEIDFSALG